MTHPLFLLVPLRWSCVGSNFGFRSSTCDAKQQLGAGVTLHCEIGPGRTHYHLMKWRIAYCKWNRCYQLHSIVQVGWGGNGRRQIFAFNARCPLAFKWGNFNARCPLVFKRGNFNFSYSQSQGKDVQNSIVSLADCVLFQSLRILQGF